MWSYRFKRKVLEREMDLYYVPYDGHYLVLGEEGPFLVVGASRELLASVPVTLPQGLLKLVERGERYLALFRTFMGLPPGAYVVDSCDVKSTRFHRLNTRLGPVLALAALVPLLLLYLHVITAIAALVALFAMMVIKVIFTLFEWREDKQVLARVNPQLVDACPTDLVVGNGYVLLVWKRGEPHREGAPRPLGRLSDLFRGRLGLRLAPNYWAKLKLMHMIGN